LNAFPQFWRMQNYAELAPKQVNRAAEVAFRCPVY
jgi:hypothetical protein